jgi:hypothetical protein
MQEFRIVFDMSEAETQMEELRQVIGSLFPEGPSDEIVKNLKRLSLDIVLSNRSTTVATDGSGQYVIRGRFGASYEHLMSAMRAGKFHFVSHDSKL